MNDAKFRRTGGTALFYHRDSTGRHDQTPGQYVQWVANDCAARGLNFVGSSAAIHSLITSGEINSGDIYLDYDVQGHVLQRPALNALLNRIDHDLSVSDLYIHHRERLARPDDPLDAVQLENDIRRRGIRVHYRDRILEPIATGKRTELSETITAVVDYHASGEYRRNLANKIIPAQINLAREGFSTGGRAPLFLARWLVDPSGNCVRPLADGEIVRMAGHHVIWLPGDKQKWELALRIIEMLEKMPATQVAVTLTNEGTPSPDAGRIRKDNGIYHPVSGVWHVPTVVNVARGMLLVGKPYGRRSMGDQQRFTPIGPRDLSDGDYRRDEKPKVVANPESSWILGPLKFKPPFPESRIRNLLAELDRRAGTQRGKPRSPDPTRNPLGMRVFDMDCGWPMYRVPYEVKGNKTFRYKCGAYMQSHGVSCSHNHVDGPLAAAFSWRSVMQRLTSPQFKDRVRLRLESLLQAERLANTNEVLIRQKTKELSKVRRDLVTVSKNLARAKNQKQYETISEEFDALKQKEVALSCEIDGLQRSTFTASSLDDEVDEALGHFDELSRYSGRTVDFSAMREVFELTNLRLFLRFESGQWGKRKVQRISGGAITFGTTPPPVTIYQGKTGRSVLKKTPVQETCSNHGGDYMPTSDGKENSLGNVSRGDRI